VLLGNNMESVIAAIARCKGQPEPNKLQPPLRDSWLASIAWRADFSAIRECVLTSTPSLRYLVHKLAGLVQIHVARCTAHG